MAPARPTLWQHFGETSFFFQLDVPLHPAVQRSAGTERFCVNLAGPHSPGVPDRDLMASLEPNRISARHLHSQVASFDEFSAPRRGLRSGAPLDAAPLRPQPYLGSRQPGDLTLWNLTVASPLCHQRLLELGLITSGDPAKQVNFRSCAPGPDQPPLALVVTLQALERTARLRYLRAPLEPGELLALAGHLLTDANSTIRPAL